jgi:hypothetical protein
MPDIPVSCGLPLPHLPEFASLHLSCFSPAGYREDYRGVHKDVLISILQSLYFYDAICEALFGISMASQMTPQWQMIDPDMMPYVINHKRKNYHARTI